MAYELHGLLAGNVSIVTGENIKPSYGGDDEAFLRKVITPLYRVIEKVCYCNVLATLFKLEICLSDTIVLLTTFQEAEKSKKGKAPHSAWCNYDDLNEYFWSVWAWYQFSVIMLVLVSSLDLAFLFFTFSPGHLIASLSVGLCVMMVNFLNQHVTSCRFSLYFWAFPTKYLNLENGIIS